jgi:hypothetical protein
MHRAIIVVVLRTVAVALAAQLSAAPVHAQAWLPAKGEGSVSVLFSSMLMKDHMWPAGTGGNPNLGRMDSNAVLFDLTYGVSDRVAVGVSLPVVTSRYTGANPHLGRFNEPSPIDDGRWHTTGQDFRFNVRYNVWTGAVVVTPFVGSVVPSHDYYDYGHASPGRDLPEVLAGVSVAKLFAAQGLFVQGRYAFGVGKRVEGILPQHSEAQVEVGYFVTPTVRVMALAAGRASYNGIAWFPTMRRDLPWELWSNHDRLSSESFLNLGGGAAIALSDSLDLFGSFIATKAGANTHRVNRGITTGLSWSFRRRGPVDVAGGGERTLLKCLCEKSAS